MVSQTVYKNRPAVTVESEQLRMTVLPEDGAKIASLVMRGSEKELLLTKGGENYKRLTYDGSYVDSECSAFDDMFPTIDPYTPTGGEYAGITYPDHGECCRIPYEVNLLENGVSLVARSKVFSAVYEKTVSVSDDGGIDVSYSIKNLSDAPFECIYAGHIMLKGEDGMLLRTPFPDDAPIEMIFATEGASPTARDRLVGFSPKTGAAYKFYYTDKIEKGLLEICYPDGHTLRLEYDEQKLPYLGVWLNNGEFQDIYSLSPEPCTAPFDAPDKAKARGYACEIPGNGALEFTIHVSLQ